MQESTVRETLEFGDNGQIQALVGPGNDHLKRIAKTLGLSANHRGNRITLEGGGDAVRLAASVLEELYSMSESRLPVTPQLVDQAIELARDGGKLSMGELRSQMSFTTFAGEVIFPRTENQLRFLEAIDTYDCVFGVGPAGTGKSFLAIAKAVDMLQKKKIRKIVLTRPAVEAGEKLGFLPGTLQDKLDPYLRPLYDALFTFLGYERTQDLLFKNIIEIVPLAYMRGRTLESSFIILDEAQNTTRNQMKLCLTRLGLNSKVVINGDGGQIDLPSAQVSGLPEAVQRLHGVEGIYIQRFVESDCMRHPIVKSILRAYGDSSA